MRAILAVLVLLTLAFAGCASKGGDGDDDGGTGTGTSTSTGTATSRSGTSTGTATGSASGTGTGAPGANVAPVANLTANTTRGLAPLAVTFTLNATDADGDSLTWTLSFGDGSANETGTAVPATVSHTYSAVGNYTANFTVSDSEATVTDSEDIVVRAAATGGSTFPLVFDGEVTLSCVPCQEAPGAGASISWNSGEAGLDSDWFVLPADAAGHDFQTSEDSDLDSDVEFFDTCSSDGTSLGAFKSVDAHESGEVPAGAGCAVMWTWYPVGPNAVHLTIL